jgi:hypothetical protein
MVHAIRSDLTFRNSLDTLLGRKLSPDNDDFDPALTAAEPLTLVRVQSSPGTLDGLTRFLNQRLSPFLRTMCEPIPGDIIRKLRKNYSEQLPKTMRVRTASLDSKSSKAGRIAASLGIIDILASDQLRQFGERVTGKNLLPDPGRQIICYEPGDYSGPHTDHHPEHPEYRDGYVDIHIMLSSPAVASQLLVYERRRGLLNEVAEIGRGVSIAVYQLPFWHYTTPMIPRAGGDNARRWLMLASYMLDRTKPRSRDKTRRIKQAANGLSPGAGSPH